MSIDFGNGILSPNQLAKFAGLLKEAVNAPMMTPEDAAYMAERYRNDVDEGDDDGSFEGDADVAS